MSPEWQWRHRRDLTPRTPSKSFKSSCELQIICLATQGWSMQMFPVHSGYWLDNHTQSEDHVAEDLCRLKPSAGVWQRDVIDSCPLSMSLESCGERNGLAGSIRTISGAKYKWAGLPTVRGGLNQSDAWEQWLYRTDYMEYIILFQSFYFRILQCYLQIS